MRHVAADHGMTTVTTTQCHTSKAPCRINDTRTHTYTQAHTVARTVYTTIHIHTHHTPHTTHHTPHTTHHTPHTTHHALHTSHHIPHTPHTLYNTPSPLTRHTHRTPHCIPQTHLVVVQSCGVVVMWHCCGTVVWCYGNVWYCETVMLCFGNVLRCCGLCCCGNVELLRYCYSITMSSCGTVA